MYYVYLLKSVKHNWYYAGLSSDLDRRLNEHNKGQVRSTKSKKPYNLVHQKGFNSLREARNYEKYIKIRSNKEKIIKSL